MCLVTAAALMGVFAMTTHDLSVALATGMVLGGVSNSAMAGFYALTPQLYGPDLRTTGMEFASEMVVKASLLGISIMPPSKPLARRSNSIDPAARAEINC